MHKCADCGREYELHSLHCVISYRGANSLCKSHEFSHLYCDSCVIVHGMTRLQEMYNPDKPWPIHFLMGLSVDQTMKLFDHVLLITDKLSQELLKKAADPEDYVASASSWYFHKQSCENAKRILPKNLIRFQTEEEATNHGYYHCSICLPELEETRDKI